MPMRHWSLGDHFPVSDTVWLIALTKGKPFYMTPAFVISRNHWSDYCGFGFRCFIILLSRNIIQMASTEMAATT